ncbi:MAG: hypothetical protein OEV85_08620 [Candidatus Thorarchaeota archaeon]|nr:hypothetical protein [Candidatus Thorarchaeota archaeon]
MSTTFKTIMSDMKSSLHLAWGSALSYFLANLGMVIVVAILAALIALPILSVVLLALWPFNEATMTALTQWATANPLGVAALIGVIAIPIISLFMVVSGSIYGMSYDLVAKGDTKAEAAFSYLRHKFLTFFATGAMLTIIVLLPPAFAWELAAYAMNINIGPYVGALLTAFTFVWIFFTAGLTSMVFPAVVRGKGVQTAFKESFTLARSHFDRIFGVLSAIVLLLAVTFGPIVVLGLAMPFVSVPISIALVPAIAAAALWTVVSAFLWLLLFLPMVRIVWVKVYQELTGGNIATQSVVDMPIV